jgi:peptidoglycan/LPS O-acetylase OafA/YrhL
MLQTRQKVYLPLMQNGMYMEINKNHSHRVFGLDIFRAIAITTEVIAHGGGFMDNTCLSNFPYIPMVNGVDWFFVLSGFLIGNILLKIINRTEKTGLGDIFQFWKRRWFRTLPNYYLILLVNYLIIKDHIIHADLSQFNWKFLFFLQNFSSEFMGFFWESWSLAVEEWFYIITPLLLLIFLQFLTPKKSFLLVTCLMIALPFLYRISIRTASIDDFWLEVKVTKVVITRLDSIAFGLLSSWVFYYFNDYWVRYRIHFFAAGILLTIFTLNYHPEAASFYRQVIHYSMVPFSAMLLFPYMESIKTGRGIVGRIITHISKISYSMYLVNLAVVSEVIKTNFPPTSQSDGIIKYLLYWIIVIAVSTLLYKYFEKPVMNLRDKR